MNWEKCALVLSEILRLFVNTLTTDDKYSRRNMQNIPQQLEVPLSQKKKAISGFFISFLKCRWNSDHFEEKDEDRSLVISKIIDSERDGYLNF